MYDAFETPRAVRGDLAAARPRRGARPTSRRSASARSRCSPAAGPAEVHEMVLQHEQQHNETMLQAIELARLGTAPGLDPRCSEPGARAPHRARGDRGPGGPFLLGAPDDRFGYDNERPRHVADMRALPDRPHAGHQRDLPDLPRGRRLPAPRVVVGRGLVVEGGATTSPTQAAGPPVRRVAAVARGRLGAAAPRRAGGPRLLVRGGRLRQIPRSSAPDRAGVGEGGGLGPGARRLAPLSVG